MTGSNDSDAKLAGIAFRLRAEHAAAHSASSGGFGHAVEAGKLLFKAGTILPRRGELLSWIEIETSLSSQDVLGYMKFARLTPEFDDVSAKRVQELSLLDALAFIKNLPALNQFNPVTRAWMASFAERLKAETPATQREACVALALLLCGLIEHPTQGAEALWIALGRPDFKGTDEATDEEFNTAHDLLEIAVREFLDAP